VLAIGGGQWNSGPWSPECYVCGGVPRADPKIGLSLTAAEGELTKGNDHRWLTSARCAACPFSSAGNVRLGILRKANTLVLSDPAKIVGHPAMLAMIALGEHVVPLTQHDSREKPSLSGWASTF
jgi:hypothetical protein